MNSLQADLTPLFVTPSTRGFCLPLRVPQWHAVIGEASLPLLSHGGLYGASCDWKKAGCASSSERPIKRTVGVSQRCSLSLCEFVAMPLRTYQGLAAPCF